MASDLLLLAVRYIANELPGDELAAFEDRLEHDQAAREAVAEAVELSVAFSRLPAANDDLLRMRSRGLWIGPMRIGAAAACLAVAVGLAIRFGGEVGPDPAHVPGVPGAEPHEAVALAWSGLRQADDSELVSHTELLAWLDEPMTPAAPDLQPPGSSAMEDELLPRWLLEAASLRDAPAAPGTGIREN